MWKYLVAVLAVGCGDNLVCAVDPQIVAPDGPLTDVELPLPTDCVEGGIGGIAGRWFVRDPDNAGVFHYPMYEARCDGRIGTLGRVNDHELGEDNNISHQWTDGTYLYSYSLEHFDRQLTQPGLVYETAYLDVVCMRSDESVGGAWAYYTTDYGASTGPLVGSRFGPKDDLASGLELVGEIGLSSNGAPIRAFNLVVEGDLAYVIGPTGLDIVDVANPAAPRALSHQEIAGNDVRIAHVGGRTYAYVAAGNTTVFDVTDPSAPVLAKRLDVYSHSLQIADGKLYLANVSSRIPVYDYVTDPVTPLFLGEIPVTGGAVHDLTVDGTLVFANGLSGGFFAVDTSAGLAKATELAHAESFFSHASWVGTTSSGRRVVLHGDEGMSGTSEGGAFLKVLGGDPALPDMFMKPIGGYQTRHEVGIHNFEMHGDRVYIAYYQDGVRVVDVAQPSQPREVAHYNTYDFDTAKGNAFEGALGIRVANGLVFVADSNRGLLVLREI